MQPTTLTRAGGESADRTLIAALAAILDMPADDLFDAVAGNVWRRLGEELATRGLALVPVRDPERFQWGGYWIARRGEAWAVMAGTPSAAVFSPALDASEPIAEGYVVARPALDLPRDPARSRGVVAAIYRAVAPETPMESLTEAAVDETGIVGDRYAAGTGHFSAKGTSGRALTLIEAENIAYAQAEHGVDLDPADTRRSVVTRGIDLHGLIGRRFTIGTVECYAQRLAEPCAWLQRSAPPGTLRALVHRGGIRVDVQTAGTIAVGDEVVPGPDV